MSPSVKPQRRIGFYIDGSNSKEDKISQTEVGNDV